MYNIIDNRKIWLTISSVIMGLSIVAIIVFGLNFGIDFTGGSLLEVEFTGDRPSINQVSAELNDLELGSLVPQPIGEKGMVLRFQDTSEAKHQEVLQRLNNLVGGEVAIETEMATTTEESATTSTDIISSPVESYVTELRFDSVGPTIGAELKQKSLTAMIIVLLAIVLYIAWAFRKVSKPVASWKYGLSAIAALFHDVIITIGIFAVLGKFLGIEVNTAFVAAILTVLGYSVNDTIVVFDRVRENLPQSEENFAGTINIAVNQTIKRSINTSVTTLLVLLSILFFGGSTIRDFILALSIGVFIGTYSSIFLASPLLVVWEKLRRS